MGPLSQFVWCRKQVYYEVCAIHPNTEDDTNQEHNKYVSIISISRTDVQFALPYEPEIYAKTHEISDKRIVEKYFGAGKQENHGKSRYRKTLPTLRRPTQRILVILALAFAIFIPILEQEVSDESLLLACEEDRKERRNYADYPQRTGSPMRLANIWQ